jgi:phosphoribosylformimino-5-aminoimidazole carboxamide ribotide isomerase
MRIFGVLVLRDGRAVHARAGAREQYEPGRTVAGVAVEAGDAIAVARTYRDRLGVTEVYTADLDAIMGRVPQDRVVAELAALAPLWLDAGVSSLDRARHVLALGVERVIVGLETLESWSALDAIVAGVGGERAAFSLDLRGGQPVARGAIPIGQPADIAARAFDAGVQSIIVIDLTRVGTSAGLDLDVIARVRAAAPKAALLAGGGVRGVEDIERLADAGCDGVLVGTALHDGRIGAAEVAAARALAARQDRATR